MDRSLRAVFSAVPGDLGIFGDQRPREVGQSGYSLLCGKLGHARRSPVLDAIDLIGVRSAAQAHVDPRTALQRALDGVAVVNVTGEVLEVGAEQLRARSTSRASTRTSNPVAV